MGNAKMSDTQVEIKPFLKAKKVIMNPPVPMFPRRQLAPKQFRSPKKFSMNTISINIGNGQKPGGTYYGDHPSGTELHGHNVTGYNSHRKRSRKKHRTLNDHSSESSAGSDDYVSRKRKHINRPCCGQVKMSNHTRPEWKPNFKWERTDYIIPGLAKKGQKSATEMVSMRKIKELRRKQFFNFLADFFDKFDAGLMKDKVGPDFKFTEEERERWLKKYFMKYFMEDMKAEPVKQKTAEEDNAAANRDCDHGTIDLRTGKLFDAGKKLKGAAAQPEGATREMKDA